MKEFVENVVILKKKMAKRIIKCDPKKGGCDTEFTIDEYEVKDEEFLQCVVCSRIMKNPFFEGNTKAPGYVK